MGSLGRPQRQLDQDLFDPNHNSEDVTSAVHDRMPVIFEPDTYDLWLDPGMHDMRALSDMMKPYDAQLMRCFPVSRRINHVVNDDEECSERVELEQTQSRLFI
jgi:putative SOS response-associated peptidase YedK